MGARKRIIKESLSLSVLLRPQSLSTTTREEPCRRLDEGERSTLDARTLTQPMPQHLDLSSRLQASSSGVDGISTVIYLGIWFFFIVHRKFDFFFYFISYLSFSKRYISSDNSKVTYPNALIVFPSFVNRNNKVVYFIRQRKLVIISSHWWIQF